MFLDARRIPEGAELAFDVCIIGAGVAGISIARELAAKRVRVCLLESGSFKRQRTTQQLYAGKNVSQIYEDDGDNFKDYLTITRSRYFGGSSNCWGGWCRPFDELDFKRRDWISHLNGWPIPKSELMPYYSRAHAFLKIGPVEYDPRQWQDAVGQPDFRVAPFVDSPVNTLVSQFSGPVRLGREYREEIAAARMITVFLRANAVSIEIGDRDQSIERVQVATLSGRRFGIGARYFVLAAGGIENPRLLLASNQKYPRGLGNERDLVGRFFMEHLTVPTGRVVFDRPGAISRAYNSLYCYNNPRFAAQGVSVAMHLGITEEAQQRHGLLNSRTYLRSILQGDESAGVESLRNLYRLLRNDHKFPPFRASDVMRVVAGVGGITRVGLGRLLTSEAFVLEHRLLQVVEPCPNPCSRVMLGTERDALGIPRVILDWRMGDLERHTMMTVRSLIDQEMRRCGLGRVEPFELSERWPSKSQWVWHHMGTTRMDDDPKRGVVNRDCQIHGIHNLFVAGSSVFPSGGADAPTLTIAALALRLSDHVYKRLHEPTYVLRYADESAAVGQDLAMAASSFPPPEPSPTALEAGP